jgi:FkbM family methyltransferase
MLKRLYKKIKRKITSPTERELRVREWKKSGNEDLRYHYDLNQDSIVFDMGGYRGQWASDIFSMYVCKIYVFEPVKKYCDDIKKRFLKNNRIQVFQFGLSGSNTEISLGLDNDGSSAFNKENGEQELVQLKTASEFIKNNGIQNIDLLKINIEGGEYDLLDHLIESDCIKMIKNIQVQFHDFVPKADERMQKIREQLKKTHRPTYQADFVWENWELQ